MAGCYPARRHCPWLLPPLFSAGWFLEKKWLSEPCPQSYYAMFLVGRSELVQLTKTAGCAYQFTSLGGSANAASRTRAESRWMEPWQRRRFQTRSEA